MAADAPELAFSDVRRVDKAVTTTFKLLPQELFHLAANDSALGVPKHKALAIFVRNRKQIELAPQPPVISTLDFLTLFEPCVELFLLRKSDSVDALHLR